MRMDMRMKIKMNINTDTVMRWVFPLLLAIVITSGIRLVTDIASSFPFWNRPMIINLKDFLLVIISCYILDFMFRYLIGSRFLKEKRLSTLSEYTILTLLLFIAITGSTFLAHYFIDSPNYLIDFVISYVVAIPVSLFYYTMIRSAQISREYARQTLQVEKIKSEKLAAELDYLKAQYHPHFLFNALNTVYFQIDDENRAAKQSIEHLSELLRYQLYDIKEEVTLEQEVHYLESYIAFRKLRMSERLKLTFTHDVVTGGRKLHPLLFQSLLENAFKYVGGDYWIHINLAAERDRIRFIVENATDGTNNISSDGSGIGIENLRRRLELLYPGRHTLTVRPGEKTFYAELTIHANQ